ncbi:MAG: nodulation protein NfeD [Candidatus Methylacidiphilales bacterium]
MLGLAFLAGPVWGQTKEETPLGETAPKTVYVIPIDETIDVGLRYFFNRAMKEAAKEKADFLILDMNTPGGRGDVMEEVMKAVGEFAHPANTITYVNREAGSAGALIAAATRRIYMAPGGVIGAATPVIMGQGGGVVELPEKFLSYYAAKARSAAERNGHFPEVFEAMVRKDSGLELFGEVIVKPGNILTFTAEQAIRKVGNPPRTILAEGIKPSLEELVAEVVGADARIIRAERSAVEHMALFLVTITPGLLAIAFLCGYLEFQTPGFGVLGAIAAICLLLAFGGHYIGGLTGHESILLIGLGLVLLAVELFIFPGTLLPGLIGATLVLVGLLWMMTEPGIAPPEVPDAPAPAFPVPVLPSGEALADAVTKLSISLALALAGIFLAYRFLPKMPLGSSLVLAGTVPAPEDATAVRELALRPGTRGRALSPLRPSGTADFQGTPVDVLTEGEFVGRGEMVEVLRVEGAKVTVRKVEEI